MNKQSPAEAEGRQDSNAGSPTSGADSRPSVSGVSGGPAPDSPNQAVLGPFTVRDLAVFGAALLLFIASLLPLFAETYNLWNLGNLFSLALGILLPLIVVALFVARRLAPQTSLRIGSLSVDQFASVTASYTVGFFFLTAAAFYTPILLVGLLGALLLFTATVLGRFIPFFAGDFLNRAEAPAHVVARDSAAPVRKPGTPKTPKPAAQGSGSSAASTSGAAATWKAAAAKTAAAVASVTGKSDAATSDAGHAPAGQYDAGTPAGSAGSSASTSPAPVAAAPAATAAPTAASAVVPPRADGAQETQVANLRPEAASDRRSATPATTVNPHVRQQEPIGATVDPASRPEPDEQPTYEAFWFAVAQPRTAVDPRTGAPSFVIEPGGWVLALEDRGSEFLVQHTDGRVGILHDLSNIERG